MIHQTNAFYRPASYAELFQLTQGLTQKYAFLAGGVSLNWHGNRIPVLISLEQLIQNEIKETTQYISIGAGVKLADLAEWTHPVYPFFKALSDACLWIASPQLRNMATIGGNLISHFDFSDSLGFFYLTEPQMQLIGPEGQREAAFQELLSPRLGRFKLPEETVLHALVFAKNRIAAYERSAFIKESRVGFDVATLNITTLKHSKQDLFDIAIGACWANVVMFRNIADLSEITVQLESLKLPKADQRASSEYRNAILIPSIERSIQKCLKA